ncbi:MAG: DNA mismatch repair protein MutS [Alphaproteobacteria bacterium]|nr:DNA mismatch repair protein MutS [Alphaproteobacteria bacterium]
MSDVFFEKDKKTAVLLKNTPETDGLCRAVSRATPMMAQYIEIKIANPGSLLFYRMGDFYELFFEDAEIASRALGISLTKRGRHMGEDVPMCGVPVHASVDYLHRLIRLGHRVAVCEQLEDPSEAKKRGPRSVVHRDVVRLVTAGTLTEDTLLEAGRSNYLAALSQVKGQELEALSLAWLDISTGAFHVSATSFSDVEGDMARLSPSELLIADSLLKDDRLIPSLRLPDLTVTPLPQDHFDSVRAERRLCDYFNLGTLDAYGPFTRAQLSSCGALISYVNMTQAGKRPVISPPRLEVCGGVMRIDPATRLNLEMRQTLRGKVEGSLLSVIDRTQTASGARLLSERLSSPLTDHVEINARLAAVGFFLGSVDLREEVRQLLKSAPDLARALSRLSLGRGGPRDLGAMTRGLKSAALIAAALSGACGADLSVLPEKVAELIPDLIGDHVDLISHLEEILADELPLSVRDGGVVRAGYSKDLDDTRDLRSESRKVIVSLQARYVSLTGIKSLKIKHNNMLGYFVEVSVQSGSKLLEAPLNTTFTHRWTSANVLRFSTGELSELESRILSAAQEVLSIEQGIFENSCALVLARSEAVKLSAAALAVVDVYASLAVLAHMEDYTRPCVDSSLAFSIKGGCHPIVRHVLKRDGVSFVANDCNLGPPEGEDGLGQIWLITGPNMAGKSTFLRQNALIAILAQMGSYVPARQAHIGVVDQLFSRVGAADDLARGRSTFMVEMVETGSILNQAGERSLVILDEIGRGTSTFDGLSIAWACVEYLHDVNRARTLFATHFHELTNLSGRLGRIVNATMRVREWEGEVIFLHEAIHGVADRSYGIHVARRAGLPLAVIKRADSILNTLEEQGKNRIDPDIIDDFPLFSSQSGAVVSDYENSDEVVAFLETIAPDELTPREALDVLYRLKRLCF